MAGGCFALTANKYITCKEQELKHEILQKHKILEKYNIDMRFAFVSYESNKHYFQATLYMEDEQAAILKLSGEEVSIINTIRQVMPLLNYGIEIVYKNPKEKPFRGTQL